MTSTIDFALQDLLPTLSGEIPKSIVELASSLLSQSKLKIKHLKPEEEIARTYLCAHLAAKKLCSTKEIPVPIPRCLPVSKTLYDNLFKLFSDNLVFDYRLSNDIYNKDNSISDSNVNKNINDNNNNDNNDYEKFMSNAELKYYVNRLMGVLGFDDKKKDFFSFLYEKLYKSSDLEIKKKIKTNTKSELLSLVVAISFYIIYSGEILTVTNKQRLYSRISALTEEDVTKHKITRMYGIISKIINNSTWLKDYENILKNEANNDQFKNNSIGSFNDKFENNSNNNNINFNNKNKNSPNGLNITNTLLQKQKTIRFSSNDFTKNAGSMIAYQIDFSSLLD